MTHPTTDQNIRERLARAAWNSGHKNKAFEYPWGELPALAEDWGVREHWLQAVDAILSELQEPSEGMLDMGQARIFTRSTVLKIWQAMIRHIRDGGK